MDSPNVRRSPAQRRANPQSFSIAALGGCADARRGYCAETTFAAAGDAPMASGELPPAPAFVAVSALPLRYGVGSVIVLELGATAAVRASTRPSTIAPELTVTDCGDPKLSQLDGQLAQAYRRALEGAGGSRQVRAEQRAWLRTERNACGDEACLKTVYAQRLAALAATPATEKVPSQGPVESAPAGDGLGETFKLAPVLDQAKGDAAVVAYHRGTKEGALALASGSFTRAGADEVLLVVPSGLDLAGGHRELPPVDRQRPGTGGRQYFSSPTILRESRSQ
jgi:uncharacterized protein